MDDLDIQKIVDERLKVYFNDLVDAFRRFTEVMNLADMFQRVSVPPKEYAARMTKTKRICPIVSHYRVKPRRMKYLPYQFRHF